MKKKLLLIALMVVMPFNIYAYSNKIIVGGDTIGIEVHSNGVYVVGFYDVINKSIAKNAGFKIGDIIIKINDKKIDDINSLNKMIEEDKEYTFTVLRENKEKDIKFKLEKEDNLIKTGLYVKDQINGIGTLSYIDPETRIFGSLGHEIFESSSMTKFNIKDGVIYKAEVKSIKKSTNGTAGEKQADYDKNSSAGSINKNEQNGIFGKYLNELPDNETFEVATKSEVKKGAAYIKTVINKDEVDTFDINIISIDEGNTVKNILFEIVDEELLKKTGGVIQGMSGSPIIQNNKIIGVVNYVILNETNKGYGVFITTMLEEGDKLVN